MSLGITTQLSAFVQGLERMICCAGLKETMKEMKMASTPDAERDTACRVSNARALNFAVEAADGSARSGTVRCARGTISTPAFMPVGTVGSVKGLSVEQLLEADVKIVLGNTYHLMLRPGGDRIERLGGLHKLMRWSKPILTDSGGFQAMSLGGLTKISDDAVRFQAHHDGSTHILTPERAIALQAQFGSDVMMQLDHCVRLPCSNSDQERAMERSRAWAERSLRAFEGLEKHHALFGIVQGGDSECLRLKSANALVQMPFDGYAIGGLAVGEPQETMLRILRVTCAVLPEHKPRYLMGVGKPDDLLKAIACGVDLFDCVLPTRAGRHGLAYTSQGPINLKRARYAEDTSPLDPQSRCPVGYSYSKAYLHHLVRTQELLGLVALSWNNIWYYQTLMCDAREAIRQGCYAAFCEAKLHEWSHPK